MGVREKLDQRNRANLQLRRAFKFFDRDSSQTIDIGELSDALEAFGLQFSEAQVVALFAMYDKNNEGSINYADFTAQVHNMADAPRGRRSRGVRGEGQPFNPEHREVMTDPLHRRGGLLMVNAGGRTRHIIGGCLGSVAARQLQEFGRSAAKHGRRASLPSDGGRYGHLSSIYGCREIGCATAFKGRQAGI